MNQALFNSLVGAFKGMFPQEINSVMESGNKFFGFRSEPGKRTKFLANSFASEQNYQKEEITEEVKQLAWSFQKNKLCLYRWPESQEHSDIPSVTTDRTKPIITDAEPQWLNPTASLNVLEDINDLFWLWRYKNPKYQWAVIDTRAHKIFVLDRLGAFPGNYMVCEYKQLLAVANSLVKQGKLKVDFSKV